VLLWIFLFRVAKPIWKIKYLCWPGLLFDADGDGEEELVSFGWHRHAEDLYVIDNIFDDSPRVFMVERKFKDSGLVTDIQLLGMRSMAELLDTITRHGVLYAVVVTTQHEVHRSVTVNILHGTPQGKI